MHSFVHAPNLWFVYERPKLNKPSLSIFFNEDRADRITAPMGDAAIYFEQLIK